ncbi:TIGR02281 family clan AA aspartic protease [Dongia sp.]|uniref:retropepsin-like aspartic protease family protein n=1 Tax=Dongia sp. TaxID=1977262 RepID=UPI0035B00DB3
MQGRSWLVWALIVVGGIAVISLIGSQLGGALDDEHTRMRFVYLIALLVVMGGGFFVRLRYDTSRTLGQLAIWVAIFAGFVLLYSFRGEFGMLGARLSGELMPLDGRVESDHSISFPMAENGHYRVRAMADGVPLDFTIDTGATDVVLSPRDAERLGFDLDQLQFTKIAETANGLVRGAPVEILNFAIGPIVINNLPATVNEADMSDSLLGMEFLRRLRSWRVENERLTLEQ